MEERDRDRYLGKVLDFLAAGIYAAGCEGISSICEMYLTKKEIVHKENDSH